MTPPGLDAPWPRRPLALTPVAVALAGSLSFPRDEPHPHVTPVLLPPGGKSATSPRTARNEAKQDPVSESQPKPPVHAIALLCHAAHSSKGSCTPRSLEPCLLSRSIMKYFPLLTWSHQNLRPFVNSDFYEVVLVAVHFLSSSGLKATGIVFRGTSDSVRRSPTSTRPPGGFALGPAAYDVTRVRWLWAGVWEGDVQGRRLSCRHSAARPRSGRHAGDRTDGRAPGRSEGGAGYQCSSCTADPGDPGIGRLLLSVQRCRKR